MMLNKVSLNTIGLNRIGLNRIGKPSRGSSDRPYIDPEVLASLKAVCICYGKSNDDPDRAVVKNLVDPDNPFVISNAAFKLNSGFGKYSADFESFDWAVNISQKQHNKATISLNGRLCNHTAIEVDEMKVNIIGNVTELIYWYIANPDDTTRSEIRLTSGINTLPKSYAKDDGQTYNIGFAYISGDSEITIEQIPSFEGAFVTDGIDDLISSTKTLQEMGIAEACTVISMIHQINTNENNYITTNSIRTPYKVVGRNIVKNISKTGIYGWYKEDVQSETIGLINNVLGDKNDYSSHNSPITNTNPITDSKFYVTGYNEGNNVNEISQVAWYWTIIANKVLTTDQINQVIAYFNLDRTLKPDILCNTIKQGITNENHAEFGDKLIDFSGNGRDIQLNNIAWKGDSGIGKYEVDFASLNYNNIASVFTATYKSCSISKIIKDGVGNIFYNWGQTLAAINSTKIQVTGLDEIGAILEFTYLDESGNGITKQYSTDGIYDLPASAAYQGDSYNTNFRISIRGYIGDCDITITQIPSHAGSICLDGVNDFGKVTGMPIYKDYTFIADRYINNSNGGVASKSLNGDQYGAFIYEVGDNNFSFNVKSTKSTNFNKKRTISYLSKYSYNGENVDVGNEKDSDLLWIGTFRDNDTRFSNIAIYSLMSFPYSMSEFLIERQLKKHKLGTLYPDMVEFRPIVKSNAEYQVVDCYIDTLPAVVGNYYPINSKLRIAVTTKGAADEVTSLTVDGVSLGTPSVNGNRFTFNGTLSDKSPQKINITIDEYIRYEDIVQPYPDMIELKQNDKYITWGDKLKVGSEIIYYNNYNSNPLSELYNLGTVLYNGTYIYNGNIIEVKKAMTFTSKSKWKLDNNEPKCILSPRLLRIPNSSYKILGHIPDISGHGNHGKINNSAYSGMSGANGYTEAPFSSWNSATGLANFTISNNIKLNITKVIAAKLAILYLGIGNYTAGTIQRYKVTGVDENHPIVFGNDAPFDALLTVTTDGEYEVDWKNYGKNACIFTTWTGDCNITIEQISEYEGAYCLDGVDDFITIPTLSSGGKQVLMKVNWQSGYGDVLYDQRTYTEGLFSITAASETIAYNYRNAGGNTYIDGILNEYILSKELASITHNIVLNNDYTVTNSNIFIGTNYAKSVYDKMSLYDFMLFNYISTDDKIKELNEYVGIEGNTDDLFNENN